MNVMCTHVRVARLQVTHPFPVGDSVFISAVAISGDEVGLSPKVARRVHLLIWGDCRASSHPVPTLLAVPEE